ncbi:MAG: hypothetical protein NT027_03735 [Proteobacteria bacterium]|nr:hypothetical protein [Pseudomonadota bacterium]
MSQKRILAFVRKMQTLLFLCSAISCKSEFSAKIRNNKTNPATESSCSVAAKANSTDCSEPKVNSVSSLTANGRYGSATTIEVSLTFSENVLVTGIPQLTLETGKTDAVVNYSSGSGSKVLLFAYKPLVGHVTVDLDYVSISSLALNSGTIKSLKGVNANIGLPSPGSLNSLSANKSIVIDTIAPTLTAISAQGTDINTPSLPIKFTIGDSESTLACTSEYLSIATSNESLVLPGSVVFAGNYPECTAVIPPIESATGTVVITLTLRDAAGSSVSVDFNFQIRNAFAIGQPQTTSRLQIENGLFNPRAAAIAGGKLFVADSFNHRVLVYKNVPTTSGQVPTYALGQPNLQSNEVNNGGVSSSSMRFPRGVFSDGIRLFVADSTNNRVLVWNTLPTTSGQAADFALGQPSLTSATANNGGVSGSSLWNPHLVYSDGTKLYVVDKDNHRVLVWTSMPTTSGQSASFALGQPDLVSNTLYNGGVSGSTMGSPQGVFSDGIRLFVADAHRVLVWNSIPTSSGQSASFALGQANLASSTGNSGGIGAGTMFSPFGIYSDGTRLLVADAGNHRVLVWNTLPTVSGQTADLVLGQPNFTSNTLNNGGVSASSLVSPSGLFVYEGKVYLSDVSNHRLLVWNAFPTVSSQPADFVLGQPNFLSNTINHSGDLSKTFAEYSIGASMSQIYSDGTRLFVADTMSNRVLVWNSVVSI